MKELLFIFALWLSFIEPVNAEVPYMAVCSEMTGKRLEIKENKQNFTDDRVPYTATYVFNYKDSIILDNYDGKYTMLSSLPSENIVGIWHAPLGDALVTFYPKENKFVMSKHSYPGALGVMEGVDISAWTMVGDCEFY